MADLPVLFISHGAPDFAIRPGRLGPQLRELGRSLPRPEAVLMVSAHWLTQTPRVTANERPGTIHDFRGFDPALYDIRYPAAGAPALATDVAAMLQGARWHGSGTDPERGLDHGAWVPLLHMYPEADVPVLQLSLPAGLNGERAFAYGRALAPLAGRGVLIIGSGSLTHNLRDALGGTQDRAYAQEFSHWLREAARRGETSKLRNALEEAPQARRAHPTPEHYWPLVVAAGAAGEGAQARILEGGMSYDVLAMDAFVFDTSRAAV